MLTHFICPDGEKQPIKECLAGHCRAHNRCAPLNFLSLAGAQREWNGVPSTTQLINGTRQEFLKITTDYSIRPKDRVFAVLGTKAHSALEMNANNHSFTEERLTDEIGSGQFDTLEQQENGDWWLIENKTSGSFKIGKALGIVEHKRPMVDDKGEPVLYQKSGKGYVKGHQKMEKYFVRDGKQDCTDWIMQENRNRMLVEHKLNIKVSKLKVFAAVRDGGLQVARMKGIESAEYFDLPMVPDKDVDDYFSRKGTALIEALKSGTLPPPCNAEEVWGGRKCIGYCDVKETCVKAGCPWIVDESTEEGEDA